MFLAFVVLLVLLLTFTFGDVLFCRLNLHWRNLPVFCLIHLHLLNLLRLQGVCLILLGLSLFLFLLLLLFLFLFFFFLLFLALFLSNIIHLGHHNNSLFSRRRLLLLIHLQRIRWNQNNLRLASLLLLLHHRLLLLKIRIKLFIKGLLLLFNQSLELLIFANLLIDHWEHFIIGLPVSQRLQHFVVPLAELLKAL